MKILITVLTFSLCAISTAEESLTSTYESLVDDAGNITLPKEFRSD